MGQLVDPQQEEQRVEAREVQYLVIVAPGDEGGQGGGDVGELLLGDAPRIHLGDLQVWGHLGWFGSRGEAEQVREVVGGIHARQERAFSAPGRGDGVGGRQRCLADASFPGQQDHSLHGYSFR